MSEGVAAWLRGRTRRDAGGRFVHFGCAHRVIHAFTESPPEMNTKTGMRRVHAVRRYGYTHRDA